jgi:hypothetical protein
MIYVWGRDEERYGLLGLGPAVFQQSKPCPLISLIDYRMKAVCMNERFAVALDSQG